MRCDPVAANPDCVGFVAPALRRRARSRSRSSKRSAGCCAIFGRAFAAIVSLFGEHLPSGSEGDQCGFGRLSVSALGPAAGADNFQELGQRDESTHPEMADATANGSSIAGWLPDYVLESGLGTKLHDLADADDSHATLGSWMPSASASDSVTDPFAPVVYGHETGRTPDAHTPVNTDMDMNLLFSSFTPSDATHTSGSLSCSATPPSQLSADDDASVALEPGVDATLFPAHEFLDLDLALDPLPMDAMDKVLFPSVGTGIAV